MRVKLTKAQLVLIEEDAKLQWDNVLNHRAITAINNSPLVGEPAHAALSQLTANISFNNARIHEIRKKLGFYQK